MTNKLHYCIIDNVKDRLLKTYPRYQNLKEKQKMLKIYVDTTANYKPWCGAVSTYETIVEEDKLDDLDFLLEELYPEGISESHLNDILWFESDWVFAQLGIGNMVECGYCGEIYDEEDLEEDEDGEKLCPNCQHEI